MKRVLAVLLCLLCAMLLLVACGDNNTDTDNQGGNNTDNQGHTHTYKTNEDWTKDAQGHWYDATCDCEDAPITKLNHTDANNDGACDVCTFTNHEHEYTEDWTADCTNHWNAADCGHTVAGINVGAHVDEDADGRCDVCNYIIEDLHEHYYSSEWSNDGEYHWHAALCEHKVEVADKAAHVINDAGICTECNAKVKEIDKTNILAILAAAVASNNKVVTGDVKLEEIVYDGSEANNTLTVLNSAVTGAYFVLGDGQSYYFMKNYNKDGILIGGEQQWYESLASGDIFGVKMDVNEYTLDSIMGDPAKLSGYTYHPGTMLAANYDDTNTLAQTLYNFYDLMSKGVNVYGATENYDAETGTYSFSFSYFTVNELTSGGEVYDIQLALYEATVEFTVDDNFVINLANFEVKVYNYYDGGKAENDLTYDKATNTITKTPSANPSYYKYQVHQTSGERTFTSPYPKASLVPIGFDFFYVTEHEFPSATEWVIHAEELIGDILTVESGVYAYFHLGNPVPSTTSFDFIDTSDFTFTFVNNDPNSDRRAWYMDPGSVDEFLNGYSAYNNCLKLKIRDGGEYTVTIGFGSLTKTFTLVVNAAPEIEITGDEDSIYVGLIDFNTYDNEDQTYTFTATEEGNYTFTVPAGLGVRIDGEETPVIDLYDNGGTFTVGLNAGESVKLYFAAYDTTKYLVEISYAYADIPDPVVPDPEEPGEDGGVLDVIGTYIGNGLTIVIDDTNVTFTTSKGYSTVCEYDVIDGEVVLYNSFTGQPWASNLIALQISGGEITGAVYNGSSYSVTKENADGGDDGDDDGDKLPGSGTASDPYALPSAGDYVCAFPGQADVVWYQLNIKNGGYLTISSTYGNNAWFKLGASADLYSYDNQGDGTTISAYFPSGSVAYIGIGEYSEITTDVPFKVSFEEKASGDFSALVGTWYGSAIDIMWGSTVPYTLVINENGKGTITYDAGWGDTVLNITFVFVDGESVVMGYNGNLAGNMLCTYDGTTFTCVQSPNYDTFVFQTTPIEDGGDSGEGDDVVTDPVKEALSGTYTINDTYSMMIFSNPEFGYLADIYTDDWSTDLYFTFDVTDNYDGSYTLTLTYCSRPDFEVGTDKVDEILALDITITPSEGGDDIIGGNEGSAENPFTITEPGDYYAFFPGGYDPIWFTYEITQNGYVTITTEYANPWFQYGTTIEYVNNNQGPDGVLKTVTFYAFAGETVYISVGDYDFVEAGVEFSVSFEAFETESSSNLVGAWTGTLTNDWGGSEEYSFVVNADGKGTGSINYGYYTEEFDITFILVNGSKVSFYTVTTGMMGGTEYVYECTYDASTDTLTYDTVALTKGEVPGGDTEEPSLDYNTVIVEGANTLYFSADEVAANTATRKVNITKAGVYKFAAGALFISSVTDANGVAIEKVDYAYSLDVGEYTVTFGMLSMFGVKADTAQTLNLVDQTPAPEPEPEPEPEPDPTPDPDGPSGEVTGSGTQADPFVITTLPLTITYQGKHDFYYSYTATEDIVITINAPAGLVSETGAVKDGNNNYVVNLTAGQTLRMNIWTQSNADVGYVYTITGAAPVVVDPDQGGEGEGGDAAVVEYVSERHQNGRYIKFSIEGDTMTITRSNMSGGWDASTATAVYTISGSGAETATTWVSGTICTFIFGEDGLPTQIAWAGAAYVNFAIAE